MNPQLKRIIVLSIINGVAIHYFNKWLDNKNVLPKVENKHEIK